MGHKNFGTKAWLQPMPVAIIGTYDENGKANAMNAAWVGQWDFTQICISLSKHVTTDNIDKTGAFTVALADVKNVVAADFVGIVSGKKDPDKMKKAGFCIEKSEFVNAPVFTNFPITLECKVAEILNPSKEGGYNLIGEIVNVRCDEEYLNAEGEPDMDKMKLISYDSIGNKYRVIGEVVGEAFKDGSKLK